MPDNKRTTVALAVVAAAAAGGLWWSQGQAPDTRSAATPATESAKAPAAAGAEAPAAGSAEAQKAPPAERRAAAPKPAQQPSPTPPAPQGPGAQGAPPTGADAQGAEGGAGAAADKASAPPPDPMSRVDLADLNKALPSDWVKARLAWADRKRTPDAPAPTERTLASLFPEAVALRFGVPATSQILSLGGRPPGTADGWAGLFEAKGRQTWQVKIRLKGPDGHLHDSVLVLRAPDPVDPKTHPQSGTAPAPSASGEAPAAGAAQP